MSNLLQSVGLTLGLMAAPALAYAVGVQSGKFVPAESVTTSTTPKPNKAAISRPTRAAASQRAAASAPARSSRSSTGTDYTTRIQNLEKRVEVVEKSTDSNYADFRKALKTLYENQLKLEEPNGRLERTEQIVSRLEQYAERVNALYNDATLDYVKDVFNEGIQELKPENDAMVEKCTDELMSRLDLAELELKISTPNQSENQEKDQQDLRRLLQETTQKRLHCETATRAYDVKQEKFDERVQGNIFGKGRDARRVWFELGLQGRQEYQGGARAGAVVGAVTYRGDIGTVGFGVGAGLGSEAVSTEDLSQAPTSEKKGKYTQVSSQTGTERTADKYRGHLQLRAATSDLDLSKRWAMQAGGVVDVVATERNMNTDRTRTIEFLSGDQPVGKPHSASGSETELSTHYSVVPAGALDFWHDRNRDGRAFGLRFTGGVNLTDYKPDVTLSLLGRF